MVDAWHSYLLYIFRMTIFSNLALLRSFVSIAESGSISAAARNLGTTQPTLSRQLAQLEVACGTVLLRRDTHRMHLTDMGAKVLADARAMLALAEECEYRLRADQTALKGHVRFFSTIDFGQSVVSKLLARFMLQHPTISVDLIYSNRPLRMLEEGCDAGVVAGTVADETVIARPLGVIRRYPVVAPAFLAHRQPPEKPNDIANWPWLTLGTEVFGGARNITLFHESGEEQTLHVKPVLTAEGVTGLREAALEGLGVSPLPGWLVADDLAEGRLVRLLPQWRAQGLPAHVVYPVQKGLPFRVRALVDFMSEAVRELLARPCVCHANVTDKQSPASGKT